MPALKPDPAPDKPSPETAPLNREQRRREKFGHGTRTDLRSPDDPWPVQEANPAFSSGGDDAEAYAGKPDQDVTREAGPGTGGATQQAGRVKRHAGTHATNSAKG
jgi:hypothetical protein